MTDDAAGAPRNEGSDAPQTRSWFGSADDAEDDDLVGSTLTESYNIDRVLGEGAMGRVYEAHHTRIPAKRFAVKVLHPEFRRHPEALARFQREAEAAATLTHRNVVGVYDVDVAPDGRPFIVCELLEGIDLADRLDEIGTLPTESAVRIARQLCDALSVAHEAGVVHRDMKPANVFLVGDAARPLAKVLDFGLSRLENPGGESLTRAGAVMGTPAYMAPEQARGDRVDLRADVYGVGAILYRALTGRTPFDKEDLPAMLAAVLTEEPPRPRSVNPAIPEELEVIIQRAMEKEPEERFQSMDELAGALEAYQHVMGDAPQPTLVPPPRSRADTTSESILTLPQQARNARPVLLAVAGLALLWALALLGDAAATTLALVLGQAEPLSTLALVVLFGTLLAVLATPALLALRRIRQTTWNNTTKVVRLLETTRLSLLASMAAYGAAAMLIRVLDAVVVRFQPQGMFGHGGLSWPAWSIVLAAVSALSALAVVMSHRVMRAGGREPSRTRQLLAGPGMAVASLLLGGGLLYGGLLWRADTPFAPEPIAPPELASASASAAPPASASASTAASSATSAQAAIERAPAAELDAAVAKGTVALTQLAERYPDDPAVLRSLVLAYASKAETYLRALEWSDKLLVQAPNEASWPVMRKLVLRAAQGSDPAAATRAFELLADKMGSDGPDLLYDLMIASKPAVRDRAERLLHHEKVRSRGTPALRIAYSLKTSDSCADAVKLLPQAIADGDRRTVAILSFNVDGSGRGCGRRGRSRCPPRCEKTEAAAMRVALDKISKRNK